jgi:hypothetical protein
MTVWEALYRVLDRLLELTEKSVIFSGVVTIGVIGSICYLAVVGREIPDSLMHAAMIIVGFFFGARTAKLASDEHVQIERARHPSVTYIEKVTAEDCD